MNYDNVAGSPREYACPSEKEERSALYNMACCYSQLEELESGVACIRGLLEDGFDDFATLRSDPDLQFIRSSTEFESLLRKFDGEPQGGPLGIRLPFGSGNTEASSKQPRKKTWLDPW